MNTRHTRRHFLRQAGTCSLACLAAGSGLVSFNGCNSQEQAEELGSQPHNAISAAQSVADPCNDLSSLSAGDLAGRQTAGYEKRSTEPAQYCQACTNWHPDRKSGQCGTCSVVKGPIHPLARCRSWVERS